jgi:hypothetical protein
LTRLAAYTAAATISTEEAQHIAANPDGCWPDDLEALARYIGDGERPSPQAAALFPDAGPDRIAGTIALRIYCNFKACAMHHRLRGEIPRAIVDERQADHVYTVLPAWMQW